MEGAVDPFEKQLFYYCGHILIMNNNNKNMRFKNMQTQSLCQLLQIKHHIYILDADANEYTLKPHSDETVVCRGDGMTLTSPAALCMFFSELGAPVI